MSLTESDLSISDSYASARRMAAERAACRGFSTAALEAGVLAELDETLEEIVAVCGDLRRRLGVAERDSSTPAYEAAVALVGRMRARTVEAKS